MPIYDLGKVVGPQGERGIQGPPGEQGIQGPPGPTGAPGEPGVVDYGVVTHAVSTHNTDPASHNDIRLLIEGLTSRLNALANSDDETLDQMAELVAYIKDNRGLIEQVTTNKVNVSDIIDNLETNVANKPLSAAQGVALKALIDAITVPVSSVNGKTGAVQLGASDVGARPNTWTPSASDVGALPLSGGDMTGKISLPQALGLDFYGSYGDSALAANAIRSNYSNQIILGALGAWESIVTYQGIRPATDTSGAINLGEASRLWKNIYLSGVLSDGTNSVAVANIAKKGDIPNVPSWAMQASKPGYTADEVGARPNTWTPSASDVGAVPTSRTVNGKPLSSDINLAASDVNARPNTWTPTASEVGARPSTWTPSASDVGALPKSGGEMPGNIIISNNNPHLGLKNSGDGAEAYFQTYNDGTLKAGFGYGWDNSLTIDTAGNVFMKGKNRPKWNSNDMALASDIPTNKETWTFTLEDGTEVTKAVYIG